MSIFIIMDWLQYFEIAHKTYKGKESERGTRPLLQHFPKL